uniref:SOCS box domain-containing protein n=1 Tax=Echinostoma caproni TaxID=27848 RepID=A0A183B7V8_9TREM
LKKLVIQSSRWPDQSYAEVPQNADPQLNTKRFSGNVPRARRATTHPVKENDSLDITRRMDSFCGGVCITVEDLYHCYALVIGSRAENFHVNRNGGYYRSPLLHPFLSVRIPKRSCLVNRVAAFKALDIRSNWAQGATQFDPQLSEIEGCSDIYELDLPDVTFRRAITVRLPLPQWFINRKCRSHDCWDQNSTTAVSTEFPDPGANIRGMPSDGTLVVPSRPLVILYQKMLAREAKRVPLPEVSRQHEVFMTCIE